MKKESKKGSSGTQSIDRALMLLQMFDDERAEWKLSQLAKETALNRTTVYRILSALERERFLAYDSEKESYRLGSAMIVLGARALRANSLRTVAHPELVRLAKLTGEMASLEVLEGENTLILDEVKGEKQKRMNTSIGNVWPAHATSTGRILLSNIPKKQRWKTFSFPLEAVTPVTTTDKETLDKLLMRCREEGFAVVVDELEVGSTECAVPVYNYKKEVIGALSVCGPTIRLQEGDIRDIIELLRESCLTISQQMGFRGK